MKPGNFQILKQSAEKGNSDAQYELGCYYYHKQGGFFDVSDIDDPDNEVSSRKAMFKRWEETFQWFKKAADQGHPDGQWELGVCYSRGHGVDKDEKKALEWWRKAADQGHAYAQNNIGICYQRGCGGVSKDENKAVQWLKKSADQENAQAQYNLACCFLKGWGVGQNELEAEKWFERSADNGCVSAKNFLKLH